MDIDNAWKCEISDKNGCFVSWVAKFNTAEMHVYGNDKHQMTYHRCHMLIKGEIAIVLLLKTCESCVIIALWIWFSGHDSLCRSQSQTQAHERIDISSPFTNQSAEVWDTDWSSYHVLEASTKKTCYDNRKSTSSCDARERITPVTAFCDPHTPPNSITEYSPECYIGISHVPGVRLGTDIHSSASGLYDEDYPLQFSLWYTITRLESL